MQPRRRISRPRPVTWTDNFLGTAGEYSKLAEGGRGLGRSRQSQNPTSRRLRTATPQYALTSAKMANLSGVFDSNVSYSTLKPMDHESQWGRPSLKSNLIWLITTLQTWSHRTDIVKKHVYKFKLKKQNHTGEDTYGTVHAGLNIIDEFHNIKSICKGAWKFIERMKTERPSYRP